MSSLVMVADGGPFHLRNLTLRRASGKTGDVGISVTQAIDGVLRNQRASLPISRLPTTHPESADLPSTKAARRSHCARIQPDRVGAQDVRGGAQIHPPEPYRNP